MIDYNKEVAIIALHNENGKTPDSSINGFYKTRVYVNQELKKDTSYNTRVNTNQNLVKDSIYYPNLKENGKSVGFYKNTVLVTDFVLTDNKFYKFRLQD